jgi:hypothetical protein
MNTDQKAALLYDLDVCQSIFSTLAHTLEHNATVGDFHPLAVLAQEGFKKMNSIADQLDRGGVTA